MSDYTIVEREQAIDYMADYPDFGEMRSYTGPSDAEQIAITWRRMPPGTGGRGSYGHRHVTQEEIFLVMKGTLTFKIDDDVFEAPEKTAVRIAPRALRSVHNDTTEEVELVICSVKSNDLKSETEREDGFWPEEEDEGEPEAA